MICFFKKYKYKVTTLLLIIISLLVFINARPMFLNQDADVLKRGQNESTFSFSNGYFSWIPPASGNTFYIEYLWRRGISKKIEIQLKFDSSYYLCYMIPMLPNNYNYFDFCLKFNTFSGKKSNISLILFMGIWGGFSYFHYGAIGIDTGLKFIFSYHKNEYKSTFFGLSVQAKRNLAYFINFIDIDASISFGWNIVNQRVVSRHEISLHGYINIPAYYQFLIGISYSCSIGGRYF